MTRAQQRLRELEQWMRRVAQLEAAAVLTEYRRNPLFRMMEPDIKRLMLSEPTISLEEATLRLIDEAMLEAKVGHRLARCTSIH